MADLDNTPPKAGEPGYVPQPGTTAAVIQPAIDALPGASTADKQAAQKVTSDNSAEVFSGLLEKSNIVRDSFMANAGKSQALQDQGQSGVAAGQADAGTAVGLGNNIADWSGQAAKNAAAIASNTAMAAANKNAADKAAVVAVGLDGSGLTAALKAVHDNASQALDHAQHIADLRGVNFSDDPGQWLLNHVFSIPYAQGQLKDSAMTASTAQDALQSEVKALGNASAVDQIQNSADTEAQAGLLASNAALNTLIAGAKDQMNAVQLKLGAENLSLKGTETSTGALNAGTSALGGANSSISGEAAINNDIISKPWYDMAKRDQLDKVEAQTTALRADLEMRLKKDTDVGMINEAFGKTATSLGVTLPPGFTLANPAISTPAKQAMLSLTLNNAASGSLGVNAGQSFQLLQESGIPLTNLPTGQKAAYDTIGKVREQIMEATTQALKQQGKQLNNVDLNATVNEGVNSRFIQLQKDGINADTPIFGTPSLNTLVGKDWAKDNLVLQSMRPMVQDGAGNPIQAKTDFTQMLGNANNLIKSGKLSESQAVDQITNMSRNMLQDVSTAYGTKRFQIPILEQYNVQMKTGIVGGYKAVNLMNSAQVLQQLRTMRAADSASDMMQFRSN